MDHRGREMDYRVLQIGCRGWEIEPFRPILAKQVYRRLQEDSLKKPPGEGNSQNRQIWSKIEPERAPEMMPKHRKSLPNGRQQGGAFGGAQRGRRFAPPPFGVLVVFHLVRISYVLASFLEPVLVRFSTKFADSENSLPEGACLKSLPATS